MSKGRVGNFVGLYRAILKDCSMYHPTLVAGFLRDLKRLESLSEKWGECIFLLHLPAAGKVFDSALETGRLPLTGLPLLGRINTRTNIPRLFQGLWLRVFSLDGCLKQDIDPNDIFFLRTLYFACKKFRRDCTPATVYATIKEFYDVDATLPPPSLLWDGDGRDLSRAECGSILDLCPARGDLFGMPKQHFESDRRLFDDVQHVADYIAGSLGEFFPHENRFRHGPGAVADIRTGVGYKYAFPSWSMRLEHVFPYSLFGTSDSGLGLGCDGRRSPPQLEVGSRLLTVPKTQKGPRLIATEPTCNQWCQQSVSSFLTDRIRHSFLGSSIDFRRQDLSGEDARASSRSGDRATVDLSAASDRLSCWLIQRLFRGNFSLLSAMIASRTRYLCNDVDKKMPSLHKLRKFSTAGSALTFPIQSIAFLMICAAAGRNLDSRRRGIQYYVRQVRVYGDDLIVPVAWVPRVKYILSRLYLKVNSAKTFWNGKFRESCGTDAFDGHIVTPAQILEFYSESKPSTLVSTVDVSNNLFFKGLWHAAEWVTSTIPHKERNLLRVVRRGSGSFGLESHSGFLSTSRNRWNTDTHTWEVQAFAVLAKRSVVSRHEGYENLLQYFTEDPSKSVLTDWASGVFSRSAPVIGRRWVQASLG